MPLTCEFTQGSKLNPDTGVTEHDIKCGKPAAECSCQGELTSIVMPLCEYHRHFVANHYHWIVKTVS